MNITFNICYINIYNLHGFAISTVQDFGKFNEKRDKETISLSRFHRKVMCKRIKQNVDNLTWLTSHNT